MGPSELAVQCFLAKRKVFLPIFHKFDTDELPTQATRRELSHSAGVGCPLQRLSPRTCLVHPPLLFRFGSVVDIRI
jgi:hypothetical protein